jgi:maltose operon protein
MPHHLPQIMACAALALLLGACAPHATRTRSSGPHTRASILKKLQNTDPCCVRFSQFNFDKTLPAKPRRFDVQPGLPVANFNGTRSYFLAFTLPQNHTLPYRIVLKSEVIGRWLESSYLFAPSVALLDSNYIPIRTANVKQCEYIGWSDSTTGALGSISVDNPQARYLVIYTSAQQLASSTYWEQSPTAFSANQPVKMAATGSFQIPHGPDGALYVGVMTPKYASAMSEAICEKPAPHSSPGALSSLRSLILPGGPFGGKRAKP